MENRKTYKFSEVIDKMKFGQIAVKVSGNVSEPYSQVGTAVYFDENDYGILKFLHSGNDVLICRPNADNLEGDRYIIIDRK